MRFVMTIKAGLAALLLLVLVACGGGGGADSGTLVLPGNGSGGGGTTPGTTPTVVLTLDVQLVDSTGKVTTAVVAGQPVRAQAVLKRNGVTLDGEIVQFALVQSVDLAKLDPVSGSQLTAGGGLASITVSSLGASSGAGRVTATATAAGLTARGSANFFASGSVGTQPSTLALSGLEIGSAAVSAYGTTGIRVRVLQNGAPYTSAVTVNFTTSCAAGKATITSSAITQPDGYAVATFVDNGCAPTSDSSVTITASIGSDAKSGAMTVRAPTTGSLRFLTVVPADKSITLRGQGGNGRQENAAITFKLVDVAGNGVGDSDVCFDVTTYIGGLNLDGFSPANKPALPGSATLCGSDALSVVRYVKRTNADGTVSVQINSGTVPTPVRVRARALYPASAGVPLETFSDTLSISTGLPLQRSFSLSIDQANIDGGNFDGEVAKLTIRLADQFSNPVPDGTVVNFIASGGAVCTADNGSCKTINGACSCDFISQARRPQDNRVVITAYAVGLEDFDDNNGDNLYTAGEPFADLGDVYVDANKTGAPSSATINGDTDILIPYQQNTVFRAAGDGVRGTAHIRASSVVYFSKASTGGDATVVVPRTDLSEERSLLASSVSTPFLRLTPNCPDGTPLPQGSLSMVLEDGIGNPMAAATTLAAVDATDNVAPVGFRPDKVLAIGARPPSPLIDLPNLPKLPIDPVTRLGAPYIPTDPNGTVWTPHSVAVRGVKDKCAGSASFALEVQSPRGGKAVVRVLYVGEGRETNRFAFAVRYRNLVNFSLITAPLQATLAAATWVSALDGAAATSYTIQWGDGQVSSGAGSVIAASHQSHVYAASNANKSLTVTLTVFAGGVAYSASQGVLIPG